MRDDGVYLEYIIENIELVERFLAPGGEFDKQLFRDDVLRQAAVLRWMETLTDAAGHLSAELRSRHPEIDWPKVTGFRNILAHGYMQTDYDLAWETIVGHLPGLRRIVEEELHQLGGD